MRAGRGSKEQRSSVIELKRGNRGHRGGGGGAEGKEDGGRGGGA